jgi:hypothetical protein
VGINVRVITARPPVPGLAPPPVALCTTAVTSLPNDGIEVLAAAVHLRALRATI